jgi:hypothetical protein
MLSVRHVAADLEGRMDNRADLTRAERRFLERAAEAQEQGLTLEEYYRASGLSVGWLHNIRRQLQGKGVVMPGPTARSKAATSAKFVQVRVAEPAVGAATNPVGMVCRVRHASGWMIECGSWPPASWLQQLVGEVNDAVA